MLLLYSLLPYFSMAQSPEALLERYTGRYFLDLVGQGSPRPLLGSVHQEDSRGSADSGTHGYDLL